MNVSVLRLNLIAKRTSVGVVLASVGVLCLVAAGAVRAEAAQMAEVSQPYTTTEKIDPGTLVSIDDGEGTSVTVANQANSVRLIGVLVKDNDSTLEINKTADTVQVATSGRATAFVSTLNGDIKKGDILSLSAVAGVAAKASAGARIVGVAQESFTASSDTAVLNSIKDKYGKSRNIAFGSAAIIVSVGGKADSVTPVSRAGLFGWFEMLAGKNVSSIRLVICAFIAVTTIIVMFIIIFSSIQSTIYGVSRNPFAKVSIFEAFAKVIVMSLVVAVLAMVIVYVILRV